MSQPNTVILPFRTGHAERLAAVLKNFPFGPDDRPLHIALANAFADTLGERNSSFNRRKFMVQAGARGDLGNLEIE